MGKIRVLIADDAVVIRRLVADCLAQDPDIEVVGTAANGQIALAKLDQVNPDIVTLDIEMPVMDGLQTLAAIRKQRPRLPVIMFSTLTERGAAATLDALGLGANDYVTKPANTGSLGISLQKIREELLPKIKGLCRPGQGRPVPAKVPTEPTRTIRPQSPRILAVGVSTGGPNALSALLPGLAQNFPAPIVIVQHMPPLFTKLLAERLAAVAERTVSEGQAGALLRPGEVWVAPGGWHLEVQAGPDGVRLATHQGSPENSCRPAVDVLFRSVAKAYGATTLAVVLTGMGQDGLRGVQAIREAGGQVLVQDEASSVVWGMPGAVAQAGLADQVLPLGDLAGAINSRFQMQNAGLSRSPAMAQ